MALSPSERRRRFLANLRRQIQRRGLQRDEHVEKVLGSLVKLQQEIVVTLDGLPTEFQAAWLPNLQEEIDAQIDRWSARARGEFGDTLREAWELGPEIVDGPFAAVNVELRRPLLPSSLLEELTSDRLDLMKDLGPVAKERLRRFLRSGLLGGKTPHEVMKEMGHTLGSPGPFRFIAFRAETVYRTEMGRIHSTAGQLRLEQAAEKVPGLGKEWWWSGKSRSTHAAINHQKRAADQPFDVAGEKLQYPRDPAGSASNTINCGCESVPWMADWD